MVVVVVSFLVSFLTSFFLLVVSCCMLGEADAATVTKVKADNISATANFFIVFFF